MSNWVYPVDMDWLLNKIKEKSGEAFLTNLGVKQDDPDYVKLNRLVLELSRGWFPRHATGGWHGAVDIGASESLYNLEGKIEIRAIADGMVVAKNDKGSRYKLKRSDGEEVQCSADLLVIEHKKDSAKVYALYLHLKDRLVKEFEEVKAGQRLATQLE